MIHGVRGRLAAAALFGTALVLACGKKGPPLPPLYLVPDAVRDVSAVRTTEGVRFRFTLPTTNLNGAGPINLDRVEIYAATVAAGAASPANRELMSAKFLVGSIAVKPPPAEGAATPDAKPDPRPAPGDVTAFVEELTEAKLRPHFTTPPPATPPAAAQAPAAGAQTTAAAPVTATGTSAATGSATPAAGASAGAATTTAAAGQATSPTPQTATTIPVPALPPPVPMRVYVMRGIARNGRPGQPAARINVPLVSLPSPPTGVAVTFTASALSLSWLPPVADESAKPASFNVYAAGALAPVNGTPLAAPSFERRGVEFGKEECFVVRSVVPAGTVVLESEATDPVCVTPKDTFPPAEPTGLSAAASAGVISLIWNANTEADLAGYLVLRGEAPGDTLQAITPAPITETVYRDTAVTPGIRYIYAIVAVDRAAPPNVSGQSNRVEETAR